MAERTPRHVPRKRFGQNFLVDRGVIDSIVRAIDPRPGDLLVEIGPGLGALTGPLLHAKRRGLPAGAPCEPLHVIELDRDLAARLRASPAAGGLVIHEADALKFDVTGLGGSVDRPLRIVGNLPYNISSPLLFHLAEFAGKIRDQHFMLQKEVVERMVATHGDSAYGRLSVMLQVRYEMELLFEVPPEAFKPRPKVLSAVVRMIPKQPSAIELTDPVLFGRLVALAFSQRRKMLRNTLKDFAAPMEAVGLPPTARAEDISVADYVRFANRVAEKTSEAA